MKLRKSFWVGVLLLAMAPLSSAVAQAVYGSIYGTVTDATGAAIPNATLVITDIAKGTSVTETANGSGEFRVEHLIPDDYSVKVSSQGFSAYEQKGIHVFADSSVKVDAALKIGGSGETVEVNADTVPQLKTDRADVSTTFTAQEIVDLPIPDRNFTSLQLLLPGAQQLGWSHAASENPQGSKQIEVDGQAFAGVAFQLDGTDNQDPMLGIIVINPNSDSLSETKIATQNFDAEFGKAVSSVVTAQTKSGTNHFHGSAFDYRQSNANLARDPFSQGPSQLSAANPFPAGLKNQFGGSVGGPVLKDKFFFFGDYQGQRQKVGISNLQTVPSAHLISSCLGAVGCDFSEYVAAGATSGIYQPGTSTRYTGNVIPKAQLSQPALNLLTALQPYAPNTLSGSYPGLKNNYAKSGTGGFNSDQWDVRLDYTLNQRIHMFTRFSRFTDVLTGNTIFGAAGGSGFGLGGYGGTSQGHNDSTAAGLDIAVNNKLVTDIRAGYYRYNINTHKYDEGVSYATQLGIPGLNTGTTTTSGAPSFNIAEVGSFGAPNNGTSQGPQYGAGLNVNRCNCPLTEHEDQYQIANNWTKTLGNHSIKFGVDLRYARNLRVPSDTDRTGVLSFGTGPTGGGSATGAAAGLGFATFVLGDVTTFGRYVSTSTNAKEFQKRLFGYVQDTWQPKPNLTINYGVRYEGYIPESINQQAGGSLLNLNTGYLQVAGVGGVKSDMNISTPSWPLDPRIGIAYEVKPGTVIRAGYGRSFDIGVFGSIFGHAATQNLPILASQQVIIGGQDTATNNNATPAFSLAGGAPAAVPVTVPSNGLLPNPGSLVNSHARPTTERLPTIDAWNATLQQSITPTLSMTIAYVGNKGSHTLGDQSGQQTNPNEAGDFLPAQYSITGQALTYSPTGGDCFPAGTNCLVGGRPDPANPGSILSGTTLVQNNVTKNNTFLQRYYGLKLPACSDAAYAGVGGVNAPNGGCGWSNSIQYYEDGLDTHYNALQATLTKQLSHGYSLNANYAWQKAISEATGYSTWNRQVVKGRDGALRQQQIIVYGLFQLPFGRNKQFLTHANGFVNQIVGGWEINPVVNYSSGLPFTLSYKGCTNSNVGSAPCYTSGDARFFHKQVSGIPGNGLLWYNAYSSRTGGTSSSAANDTLTSPGNGTFTTPGVDQFGTTGRNTVFGPHFFNTDLSVQKNFPLRESITLQFRADAFNAFNHINWGTPDGNLQDGGSISSGAFPVGVTGNTRQMQFSGRVQF